MIIVAVAFAVALVLVVVVEVCVMIVLFNIDALEVSLVDSVVICVIRAPGDESLAVVLEFVVVVAAPNVVALTVECTNCDVLLGPLDDSESKAIH